MDKNIFKIGDLIENIFKKYGIDKKIKEAQAISLWSDVVGKKLSEHSYPSGVKDGTLYIICDNSVWMHELYLLRGKIVNRLNEKLGTKVISKIRLKLDDTKRK